MADFAASYQAGETPIPCVRCNQRVKPWICWRTPAVRRCARYRPSPRPIRPGVRPAGSLVAKAADGDRDQSYFLFATTPAQLDFPMFPWAASIFSEVWPPVSTSRWPRSPTAICFVPQGRHAGVVERLQPGAAEPGEIVDLEGRVLGHPARA